LFSISIPESDSTGSACHTGSQVECEKAPFVPGYNLAGEGFDVVRMRRKGAFLINVKSHMDNGTCTVCKNRFQGGQIQKLPSAVLDWRPFSRCSKQLSSALHHSQKSMSLTKYTEVLGGEKYFPDLVLNQSPAEAYSNWVKSLHDNPEVISYPIFPLYHLVADPEVSANLKRAVTAYIDENMLSVNHKENQGCSQTPNLDHNCCPMQASCGKLVVMVQRAAGLKADLFTRTDGYVKVWYYLMYEETEVVMDNNDPEWNISYDLGSVEFGHELIFEVWDSDVIYNDMVGRCVVSPERGTHSHSCKLKRGILYFTYNYKSFSCSVTDNSLIKTVYWFNKDCAQ
uniref:C2 domain-containing protein n=1 Tax=Sinocyclocheilus anshuiensis TaxID=1608454 RepID=A0A671LEW0_9TELE